MTNEKHTMEELTYTVNLLGIRAERAEPLHSHPKFTSRGSFLMPVHLIDAAEIHMPRSEA